VALSLVWDEVCRPNICLYVVHLLASISSSVFFFRNRFIITFLIFFGVGISGIRICWVVAIVLVPDIYSDIVMNLKRLCLPSILVNCCISDSSLQLYIHRVVGGLCIGWCWLWCIFFWVQCIISIYLLLFVIFSIYWVRDIIIVTSMLLWSE
jgi:hypothetical protein